MERLGVEGSFVNALADEDCPGWSRGSAPPTSLISQARIDCHSSSTDDW